MNQRDFTHLESKSTTGNKLPGSWTIKRRKDSNTALAVPDSGDATLLALAKKIRLDETESDRWLTIESADSSAESSTMNVADIDLLRPVAEQWDERPLFRVPNHIGVYTAARRWFDISIAAARCRLRVRNMANIFESAGFKVTRFEDSSSRDDFTDMWQLDGLCIVLAGGHGNRAGFIYDSLRGDIVTPHDVRPAYQLTAVEVHSCFATSEFENLNVLPRPEKRSGWIDHVTKYGSFTGGEGYLWIWNSPVTLQTQALKGRR